MQNWLQLGNWNAICDSCGRKFKASSLMKRWDGLMVCKEDFEVKHPQLSIRIPEENVAPPWVRPEVEPDIFLFYCTLEISQGLAAIGVAGCARAGIVSNVDISLPGPTPNQYPAIAGLMLAGVSISGLIHSEQPGA